jgi:nucleoside-diphosphate-sugar epimerase
MIQEPVRNKPYEAYVQEDTRLDIIYVKDAVRALLMLHDVDSCRLNRRVYNIAGFRIGQALTARDIVNALKAQRPTAAEVTFKVNQPVLDIIIASGFSTIQWRAMSLVGKASCGWRLTHWEKSSK